MCFRLKTITTLVLVVLVLAVFTVGCSRNALSYNAEIKELSVGGDRIHFARETINGNKLKVYSIKLDGTGEKFEFLTDSSVWEPKAMKGTLFENMGDINGELDSPDKKASIIVETHNRRSELLVRKGQESTKVASASWPFTDLGIGEIKWLPNSKGIIIVSNAKIGVYDINSGKYAYLTDGWMVVADK